MDTPSRESFVSQVLEVVGEKFPLVRISRADQPFSMRINGSVVSLEHLYRTAMLRPEDSRHHVERWIVELLRAAEGTPDDEGTFETVRSRLMPMVVSDDRVTDNTPVTQPFVDGLAVAYGMDNDRTISYLTQERFATWGISVDELHEAALENLLRRSQTITAHAAQDDDGRIYLILFQMMDGYDASRILLPNLHDKLRENLGSPFAAAIPNRDILLCFRNEEQTLEKLQPQIESDFGHMPHQVTDRILLVTADGIALRT